MDVKPLTALLPRPRNPPENHLLLSFRRLALVLETLTADKPERPPQAVRTTPGPGKAMGPAAVRSGRSQPADRHVGGMENSLQPQSRHTRMSGDGVSGGWLSVRGPLRYSRISAGTVARA